jgi:DNA-binding transcriptional MerR regulator
MEDRPWSILKGQGGHVTIQEMASKTGLSKDTIRYWERIGLLVPERSPNGYRRYSPEDHQRLVLIQLAKQSGFTLKELPALLDRAVRRRLTFEDLHSVLKAQRERVNGKIRELTATRARIDRILRSCQRKGLIIEAVLKNE